MTALPRKLQRYGLELLIVFLGVSLSLLAENWRQSRADAKSESASLIRLHGDMQLDAQDMRGNAARAEIGLEAARWLVANSGDTHPADSVSAMLTAIGVCSFFVPYTSEYTALKSSGKLSLISNDAIREGIVRLYEEQPFLVWLHERDCLMTSDLIDSLVGHFEFAEPLPQRRGTTRYPRIIFKAGQESTVRDPVLQAQLVRLATQRQYLVDQIDRRVTSTDRLRTLIRAELGRDSLELNGGRGGRPGGLRPQNDTSRNGAPRNGAFRNGTPASADTANRGEPR